MYATVCDGADVDSSTNPLLPDWTVVVQLGSRNQLLTNTHAVTGLLPCLASLALPG